MGLVQKVQSSSTSCVAQSTQTAELITDHFTNTIRITSPDSAIHMFEELSNFLKEHQREDVVIGLYPRHIKPALNAILSSLERYQAQGNQLGDYIKEVTTTIQDCDKRYSN